MGSSPTGPTMLQIILDYLLMFYYAINESLFLKIFAILIFYMASRIIYQPTKNWYYPKEDNDALH